jgi:hypothetical protein
MPVIVRDSESHRCRIRPAHLVWIVPLAIAAAFGLFVGVGFLTAWLWRETISDIFGVKSISFWQAWGLLLLGQLLFKASVHRNVSTRVRDRHRQREEVAPPKPAE